MPDVTDDVVGEAPLTGATVLARATGAVEAEVDGERILLSPLDFSYFGLTGSGSNVWDLIDGSRSIDDIVASLESEFEAEDGVIRADVLDFVDGLVAAGLAAPVSADTDA